MSHLAELVKSLLMSSGDQALSGLHTRAGDTIVAQRVP